MSHQPKIEVRLKAWAATYTGVVELRHMPLGSKVGQPLHSVPLQDMDSKSAAADFDMVARGDAEGIGNGPQRYVLVVVSEGKDVTRIPFIVAAPDTSDGALESEPATQAGLMAQLMRHNEATTRTMMAGVGEIMRTLQTTIARQATELDELHTRRMETQSAVEDLLSKRHERELAELEAKASIQSKQELVKEIKLLAPAVLKRLSGKEIIPTTDPLRLLVQRTLQSLEPEQLQKMVAAGGLTPQQTIAFGEILQAIEEKE